jgi:hypothetical protein
MLSEASTTKSKKGISASTGMYFIYRKLLKRGHGNEADFLGFLHKSVPHE